MKPVFSTLNVFLRQEWISVAVYTIATILFVGLVFISRTNTESQLEELAHKALLLMSMLSIFVGIYLGTGFLRLKQSHLWHIHPYYRSNLILSLVIAAFIYALIQFIALNHAGWHWYISLLAPICMTLLAAQFVIGNNLFMKFILPATPFILFQLKIYHFHDEMILLLLVIFTSLALYLNATNHKRINKNSLGLASGNMQQQLKSATVQKINAIVAELFLLVKLPIKSKDLSIALFQPANRYGLSSVFTATFCLTVLFAIDNGKLDVTTFSALLFGSMMMGVFIELKLQARQSKAIAHLFSDKKHLLFKQKVLRVVEKHIAIQAISYLTLLSAMGWFIEDFIEHQLLLKLGLTIAVIAVVFVPLMLCLNWFRINIKLIAAMLAYIGTGILYCGWQINHSLADIITLPAIAGAAALILLRWATWSLWKRQPVEQFMRVYG